MWRCLELDAKHKSLILRGKIRVKDTLLRLYQDHFVRVNRREELVKEHQLANEAYLQVRSMSWRTRLICR